MTRQKKLLPEAQSEHAFIDSVMHRWYSAGKHEAEHAGDIAGHVMMNGERYSYSMTIPPESPALKWCRRQLLNRQIDAMWCPKTPIKPV